MGRTMAEMTDAELIARARQGEVFGNGRKQIEALVAAIESIQEFAERQRAMQREMQGYQCCEEAATCALNEVINHIMRIKRGD
jgi:hypothetical protein